MSPTLLIAPTGAQDLALLRGELVNAWSRETSAQPDEWTPANRALGQCAVTALVVQDIFGGELIQAVVNGTSHYWNRLESGEEIDLTREQFGESFRIETEPAIRLRRYALSFPETLARYHLLRERLGRA